MSRFALKARFVLPVLGPPLADGVVTIDGNRIAEVGTRAPPGPLLELGNVALLPGFVNAHTHLEFSSLAQPLGTPGISLPDWIRLVIQWRSAEAADRIDAIAAGIDELIRTGTTSVGEICTGRWDDYLPANRRADLTLFFEAIAPRRDQINVAWPEIQARLDEDGLGDAKAPRLGVSPHAPYTVHPEMIAKLARWSSNNQRPLAIHLAESREELQLLREHQGPFRDLLDERQLWDAAAFPRGTRPLDFLRMLECADQALIIHGNYLDDDELAWLAERTDRMALVYCPRTHHYFGHSPYPLDQALRRGILVALGTDSRASNENLSILEELRYVAKAHPKVAPTDLLKLATWNGARALKRGDQAGSITPGKSADLTCVALPEGDLADPIEEILFGSGDVTRTWHQGREAE